jgi:DHA1 family bicyclomycin/chloramphenicol resistance-like MFS transporter
METRSSRSRQFILAILVFTSSSSILSTDLYAPSLPHLPDYFGTSAELVKLTMTLNLLTYGLVQLAYGPISDRFGRRPVLIGGMVVFTLSSLACALAQSIEQLITARVVQGVAAGAEAVLVYAIIRDLFSGPERIRALALFGIVLGATPALAPLLGGYIHTAFGWRANFYLVTGVVLIALLLILRYLPESAEPDHHALRLAEIFRSYVQLLTNPLFLGYALVSGSSLGAIFAFLTAGPFIYINNFGVATENFGLYYLFIVAGFIVGSFFTSKTAHLMAPNTSLWLGLGASLAGAVALLWLVVSGLDTPVTMAGAMCLILLGAGPVFAVGPAKALDATANRIGYAAALLGCTELVLAGVAAACVTFFHDDTSMPLAVTVLGLATAACVILGLIGTLDKSGDTP